MASIDVPSVKAKVESLLNPRFERCFGSKKPRTLPGMAQPQLVVAYGCPSSKCGHHQGDGDDGGQGGHHEHVEAAQVRVRDGVTKYHTVVAPLMKQVFPVTLHKPDQV